MTHKFCILTTILFLIIYSSLAFGQTPQNQKESNETFYFKSFALFRCVIQLPNDYNPDKSYPLVVGLHGGGGSPDNFINLWKDIDGLEFIYAVPQAPYAWLINNKIGYDWALWPTGDESLMRRASNLSESYILDLLKTLTQKYKIDSIYLMGFSQGAIFTYQIGIRNPHRFRGIICLSGPGLLEPLISPFGDKKITDWLEEKNIAGAKRLRVFIGHGKNDKSPDYNMGLKSRDILKKYGYDVTFYSFDGKHEIVKEELEHVINWLKKKKRTN